MTQRPDMNFIKRYIMELCAEATINRMRRENPAELCARADYVDRLDWPYDKPEMNQVYWDVYKKIVRDPVRSR